MSYFDYFPEELITVIIDEHLDEYQDIKSFGLFLDNNPDNYYQKLFWRKYPKVYRDVKEVIQDDIYLQSTKFPWVELYSIFRERYKVLEEDIQFKVENVFDLQSIFEVQIILYRVLFKKYFPDEYSQLIKVESFRFENFNETIHEHQLYNTIDTILSYGYYGFLWDSIAELYFNVYSKKGVTTSDVEYSDNIDSIYERIVFQEHPIDILQILIKDDKIKEHLRNHITLEAIIGLAEGINTAIDEIYVKRYEDVFKFVYLNDLSPTQDYTWEYFILFINYNNYNMFTWMLENGEKTWVNNEEFSARYEELKKHMVFSFDRYDIKLEEYSKK